MDKSLSTQLQFDCIFEELSASTKYVYKYRQQHCLEYDTFIIYIVKTTDNQEPNFIIAQFTADGLKYIDKFPMFSLESTSKLLSKNRFY